MSKIKTLTYSSKNNLSACSNFNYKLYKKFLSLKLTIYFNKCIYKNILLINKKSKILTTKIFYNRHEIVPLRILRYNLYFNTKTLLNLNVNYILTNKLSVYNGKRAKPINIFKESLKN